MSRAVRIAGFAATAGLVVAIPAFASQSESPVPASGVGLPASFSQIDSGPDGGAVWQGLIPDPTIPAMRRPTLVYLPPGFDPRKAYRVVVFLQGFRGSPYQFVNGLDLPGIADPAVSEGRLAPFLAVIPPAGLNSHYHGEWAGPWEVYLVRDVLPWTRAHLPVMKSRSTWTIAGLSAGGYGAADIGLRHPFLFGTLESWSGYFQAPHDGPLRGAKRAVLAAHDPSALVRAEARLLRQFGTRFFLSSGATHDRVTAEATRAFARELTALPHRLWLGPGGHDGKLWRAQLPAALAYALHPAS